MRINSVSSTNFSARVNIKSADNRHRKYLYNEINDITKEFKIPATFHTHEIELPSISKDVLQRLNDLGIKFSSK